MPTANNGTFSLLTKTKPFSKPNIILITNSHIVNITKSGNYCHTKTTILSILWLSAFDGKLNS